MEPLFGNSGTLIDCAGGSERLHSRFVNTHPLTYRRILIDATEEPGTKEAADED